MWTSRNGLTSSRPIHVLESDSDVKHVLTSTTSWQNDVDHITLSDGVVLLSKLHLKSCIWRIAPFSFFSHRILNRYPTSVTPLTHTMPTCTTYITDPHTSMHTQYTCDIAIHLLDRARSHNTLKNVLHIITEMLSFTMCMFKYIRLYIAMGV